MRKQFNHLLALVVFKLYVQAILDTDFHLNWTVGVRVARQGVHGNVHLADDVTQTTHDRYPQEVPTDHGEDNRFSKPKINAPSVSYLKRTFDPTYTSYGFSTLANSNGYDVF